MPSKLGKYTLVRTLGSGANSKVKYAVDPNTNKQYAIKVMKRAQNEQDRKVLELVLTEVQTMSKLFHKNIINLVEYNKEGIQEKSNGEKVTVFYIVLELAQGGELFDFVAQTGAFSEKTARYYFKQMIEAIEYVHSEGIVHRDLKPENILFDNDFNLKIADFGFAAPLTGRDGHYELNTMLGTFGYMAPEIILRKPYHGDQVDLFACAVILFIMVARHPPFNRADPRDDNFYKKVAMNRSDLFWQNHCLNKHNKDEYFSKEFKNLLTHMLQLESVHRLTVQEIKAHPWYTQEVPNYEEICQDFKMRKQQLDKEAQLQQIQKQRLKEAQNLKSKYRAVDDDMEDQNSQILSKYELKRDEYIPSISTNCELFSTQPPSLLYQALLNCLDQMGMIGEEAGKDKYKLKIQAKASDGSQIDMICRLLKVNEQLTCIQFAKKLGDKLEFYEQFQKLKNNFIILSEQK